MKLDIDVRLRSCWSTGEGELKISPEWGEIDSLWRADVLKDWIYELTGLYSEAMMEMGMPHETSIEFIKVDHDHSE